MDIVLHKKSVETWNLIPALQDLHTFEMRFNGIEYLSCIYFNVKITTELSKITIELSRITMLLSRVIFDGGEITFDLSNLTTKLKFFANWFTALVLIYHQYVLLQGEDFSVTFVEKNFLFHKNGKNR